MRRALGKSCNRSEDGSAEKKFGSWKRAIE